MRRNRNMQAHCLVGPPATSFLQYLIHCHVRAGNDDLAWRVDVSNEDRVLDRGHSLDDFRDLSFIQSHDRGETVAAWVVSSFALLVVSPARPHLATTARQQ